MNHLSSEIRRAQAIRAAVQIVIKNAGITKGKFIDLIQREAGVGSTRARDAITVLVVEKVIEVKKIKMPFKYEHYIAGLSTDELNRKIEDVIKRK